MHMENIWWSDQMLQSWSLTLILRGISDRLTFRTKVPWFPAGPTRLYEVIFVLFMNAKFCGLGTHRKW